MLESSCNICYSDSVKVLHRDSSHRYGICKQCGHVYQLDRRDSNYYHNLPYESQWDDYDNHTRNRAAYIADFCGDYLKQSKKVMDVGCGPGGVLTALKNKYPHLELEGYTSPSDIGRVVTSSFKLTFGDFEKDRVVDKYDFVILTHVMEHFMSPIAALDNLKNMLIDGGCAYIEVPSFYLCESRSPQLYCPVHLSYFTLKQLTALASKHGLIVIKSKESRYWGNIKLLLKKSNTAKSTSEKEVWWWKLLTHRYHKLVTYNIFKLIKKFKTVGSND